MTTTSSEKTLRSVTSTFFEVVAHVAEPSDRGPVRATKTFLVEAGTFTEAEHIGLDIAAGYGSACEAADPCLPQIANINPAPYGTVYYDPDSDSGNPYFRCRVTLLTVNEATGRERKAALTCLLQAASVGDAQACLRRILADSLADYTVTAVIQSPVTDRRLRGETES